jgi:hypothetical protein
MKIRAVGVELFYADIRMDRQDGRTANSRFGNFPNAPKTARQNQQQINTLYKEKQNFLTLNYSVPNCEMSETKISCNM